MRPETKMIRTAPSENGAYPPIQNGFSPLPEGFALWPDELDTAAFYEHNGFVTLTVEAMEAPAEDIPGAEPDGGRLIPTVVGYEPNTEAWEAWKATLPEPGPEPGGDLTARVEALEQDKADKTEVAAVWDQMAGAYQKGVAEA